VKAMSTNTGRKAVAQKRRLWGHEFDFIRFPPKFQIVCVSRLN
jgi:hypothetical protein